MLTSTRITYFRLSTAQTSMRVFCPCRSLGGRKSKVCNPNGSQHVLRRKSHSKNWTSTQTRKNEDCKSTALLTKENFVQHSPVPDFCPGQQAYAFCYQQMKPFSHQQTAYSVRQAVYINFNEQLSSDDRSASATSIDSGALEMGCCWPLTMLHHHKNSVSAAAANTATNAQTELPSEPPKQDIKFPPPHMINAILAICGIIVYPDTSKTGAVPTQILPTNNNQHVAASTNQQRAGLSPKFYRRMSFVWSTVAVFLNVSDLCVTLHHCFTYVMHHLQLLEPAMLMYVTYIGWRAQICVTHMYLYAVSLTDARLMPMWTTWWQMTCVTPQLNRSACETMHRWSKPIQYIYSTVGIVLSICVFAMLAGVDGKSYEHLIDGKMTRVYQQWPDWHLFTWKGQIHVRLVEMALACWWIMPIVYYSAICAMLRRTLSRYKQNTSAIVKSIKLAEDGSCTEDRTDGSLALDFESLRTEHFRLCHLVRIANYATSPLVGIQMSFLMPVLCVCVYLVHLSWTSEPNEDGTRGLPFLMSVTLYFWIGVTVYETIALSLSGGFVSEGVNASREVIAGAPVPRDQRAANSMIALLLQLNDTTVGMTAADVFFLNKQSALTLIGVFFTYFILLLQSADDDKNFTKLMQALNKMNDTLTASFGAAAGKINYGAD